MLAFVALVAALVVVIPAASGSTPYTILTTSMEPGMPPGTLIIVKPADPQSIQLGDIVTYQIESNKPEVITHRVVQIIESSTGADRKFVTQGDNNGSPDGEIKAVQIRGIVWYAVPYVGYINNMVNGDSRSVIIPIVAVVLFCYAGWMLISSILGRRRKKQLVARRAERQQREDREARIAALHARPAEVPYEAPPPAAPAHTPGAAYENLPAPRQHTPAP